MRILTLILTTSLLANAQGIITTVAGKGTKLNPDGGPASDALLGKTNGVVLDSAGNLYIGETYKGLRKVDTQGIISTLGSGMGPFGVAVDNSGNIYVADNLGNLVWKVTPSGTTSIFAGSRTEGFNGDGGPAAKAWLDTPYGVAVDQSGNVYIADSQNNRIRKVDTKGIITTFAGTNKPGYSGDGGPAISSQLYAPWGVAVDNSGNLFIADYQNGVVRKVDTKGIITTVAGNGSAACCSGEGGPALKATIPLVESVAVDGVGNLYIGQAGRVAKVDSSGTFHTIAGLGFSNDDNIPATSAFIGDAVGIAVDSTGSVLYIATGAQNLVRKVTFPSVPTISSAVNGASFQPSIVPNSWATLKGSGLAATTDTWANAIVDGKLPITLDDVKVTIGGEPAYVNYISAAQINLLVPDVAPGPQQVVVTNSAGTSSAFTANVTQYGPAFFPWPNNQVVATRQDFSWAVKNGTFAGTTTTAAKAGDTMILWGTGFGPTSPAAPVGVVTPSDNTYSTATLPTVSVGGMGATVYGAALAPGFAGLYQIAIQVPTALGNGDWPVLAAIGGEQSPAGIVLAVQN